MQPALRLNPRRRAVFMGLACGMLSAQALAIGAARPAASSAMRAVGLRCEYGVDPLGIDVASPRLFWRLASDARGARQSAWHVLVASTPERLRAGVADLWDSGRVASDQSTHVPYAGTALASSQRAFWKVQVWDEHGRPTPWSDVATWTMGILAASEWRGIWIAAPGATESLLLRRELVVRPGLVRAVAHVCGLGQYEMTLNGARVGEDLLSPGWTNYDATTLYDTYDVTAQLRAGANAVGLFLGNGMYAVTRRNRFAKFTGSFGPLRAIAHLRLEYADGSLELVGTDEAWRVHAGPITTGSIYGGEDYDARLDTRGWDRPGFDDGSWTRAVPVIRLAETLRGHSAAAEPLRAIETRSPVAARSFEDGSTVYDLGQNASYMPRLRVSGPAGSAVRLTPAEVVDADGRIDRRTMGGAHRGSSWWQYTKASDGEETWFPRFYYVGCRYLKAELLAPGQDAPANASAEAGARPHIEALEGVVVHSSARPVGSFATSSTRLGRIRDLARWAQRSNMASVLTDCPHREKLGWIEQWHLSGPALRYEFDAARIFTKGMRDMAEAQTEDGLIPNIAPEYTRFKGAFRGAAEWGAAFVAVPWQQYLFSGDLALLRAHYPAMKRYVEYLAGRAVDDILADGLGDWYDVGPQKPGAAQLTPAPVTATAYYFQDLVLLTRAAQALGLGDEARDWATRAQHVRASYNRRFFDAASGSYATGSDSAQAIPLALGIVEPAERARILAGLVADIERRGYAVTAGGIGYRSVLRALADGGRSDVIYRSLMQDEQPGYGFMLKEGATALTESWDANRGASHNHFMLGQVTEWLYEELAGIGVDRNGPGFKSILLRPQPVGDLAWVAATYDSIFGPISVRWERQGARFTLRAEVPPNTTATVFLPSRDGTAVSESGRAAARSEGVRFLRREGERMVFAVDSGRYVFESQW